MLLFYGMTQNYVIQEYKFKLNVCITVHTVLSEFQFLSPTE